MTALLWLGGMKLDARTVRDMPAELSWEYAEHKTIQGLPVLQLIDRAADAYSLSVRLHAGLGLPPKATMAQLEAAGDAGEVLILQTGGGEQLGSYVLTGISIARLVSSDRGEMLVADLTLKLKGHRFVDFEVLGGIAVEGSAEDATAEPTPPDESVAPRDVPLSQITRSA